MQDFPHQVRGMRGLTPKQQKRVDVGNAYADFGIESLWSAFRGGTSFTAEFQWFRGNADEHRGEWVWRDGAVASWTKGVGWWDRPGSFSETDGPPPVGLTRPSFDTTDEESSELSPDGGATVLGQFGWTRLREALDTLHWSELSSTLCRRTHSPRRRVNDGIHDFDG